MGKADSSSSSTLFAHIVKTLKKHPNSTTVSLSQVSLSNTFKQQSFNLQFQYLQNLQNAILIRSYCRCSLRCRQRCHHHKWPSIIRWYPGRSCLEHHLGRCRRTSHSHFEDWRGQCFDYCQHHCFRSLWNLLRLGYPVHSPRVFLCSPDR